MANREMFDNNNVILKQYLPNPYPYPVVSTPAPLSAVLATGNTSGANHIIMDAGQNVDVTGGEVFTATLNVNTIEPLAPAISTDIGIVGSLVFPGLIEMRNDAAGGGAGLTIDSIPSAPVPNANVLGYDTLTHQITYQLASSGGGENLAQTLALGNTSGANDILMAIGQKISVEHITDVIDIKANSGSAMTVISENIPATTDARTFYDTTAGACSVVMEAKNNAVATTGSIFLDGNNGEVYINATNYIDASVGGTTAQLYADNFMAQSQAGGGTQVSRITCDNSNPTTFGVKLLAQEVGVSRTVEVGSSSGVGFTKLTNLPNTTQVNMVGYDIATGEVSYQAVPAPAPTPTLAQVLVAGNTSGASDILMDAGQKIDVETITSTQTITGGNTGIITTKTLSADAKCELSDVARTSKLTYYNPAFDTTSEAYCDGSPTNPKSGIRMTNPTTGVNRRVEVGVAGGAGYTKLQGLQQVATDYVLSYDIATENIYYQDKAPSVEFVAGIDDINGTSEVAFVSGTQHPLQSSGVLGFTKKIVNTNPNMIRPIVQSMTGTIVRVARYDAITNRMYVGGEFNMIDGVTVNRICYYDFGTGTWNAMGTGNSAGAIYDIRILGDEVFVAGNFTNMSGVANTANIARYRVSTGIWLPMGTGIPNVSTGIRRMAIDDVLGRLYVAGAYLDAGGVANADNICYWDIPTASWVAMGTGTNGAVNDVIVVGGRVFIGGLFALAGGVAFTSRFAFWDVASAVWVGYGASQITNTVNSLATDGTNVFIAGQFTTIGLLPLRNMVIFDVGTFSFTQYGFPLSSSIEFLYVDSTGRLWEGGTSASGIGVNTLPTLKNNSSLVSSSLVYFDPELGSAGQWAPFSSAGLNFLNMERVGSTDEYWIVGGFSTSPFGNGVNPNYSGIAIIDLTKWTQIFPTTPFNYANTTRKKASMLWEGQVLTLMNYKNAGWAVESGGLGQPVSGTAELGGVVWSGWEE